MLKSTAHQNQFTLKPGTIWEAKSIIIAFITRVKSPTVKIFIGRVKKIRIGLTIIFKTQITIATKSADKKLETVTQGRIYAAIITAKVFISQLIINIISKIKY